MGVERVIRHDPSVSVEWPAVVSRLTAVGETPVIRMIDGQLAFPDEVPADGWTEVRVSLSGGMVTVRRQPGRVACVTWGTDDSGLRASADRLCQSIAASVDGTIEN